MAFIDVIKYEGSNDVIVFKHPTVDFNKKAKLIVHENQEAMVFVNGEAKEVYGPGKYELQSENTAGIKHIVALVSGGELANHCEVYFVNKLLFANIPWVTTAMDIQDQTMQNYYTFRAEGFFSVKVANNLDLFKILGSGKNCFTTDDLKEHFKEEITSAAKESLSIAMNQDRLSYGEINSHLTSLSDKVRAKVNMAFTGIGLSLESFRFNSINMDKDEHFEKHRGHLDERSAQQIEGYTYDKKRMYDVLEKQAENQSGAGATMGAMGAGAGYGMAMGQVMGGMVGNASNIAFGNNSMHSTQNPNAGIVNSHPVSSDLKCSNCFETIKPEWVCCPFCGTKRDSLIVCSNCGEKITNQNMKFCPSCGENL